LKYYAVREGKKTGIFLTWDDCKKVVDGYKGAKYKSFPSLPEAEAYMRGENVSTPKDGSQVTINLDGPVSKIEPGTCVAYVDGSFNDQTKVYGYGVILLPSKKVLMGHNNDEGMVKMRNVAGEIMGAARAIDIAIKMHYSKIKIYYDYEGIGKWGERKWKTNEEGTRKYADYVDSCRKDIDISFIHVPGHSGDFWNDKADALAKQAVGFHGNKPADEKDIVTVKEANPKELVKNISFENTEDPFEDCVFGNPDGITTKMDKTGQMALQFSEQEKKFTADEIIEALKKEVFSARLYGGPWTGENVNNLLTLDVVAEVLREKM
jgi:ribonuclease HI